LFLFVSVISILFCHRNLHIRSIFYNSVPLVISAIINVAQEVEEDWILEVIAHNGIAVNITMAPGDMVLYESHSVIHGRPYPLKGSYYANAFLHFEPLGYSAELERRLQAADKTAKEKFQEALEKQIEDTAEERAARHENRKADLPRYIKEGTPEAARWRQESVFQRVEIKEKPKTKSKTAGVTSAHILAALDDVAGLEKVAAMHPGALDTADSNGWKPIHEAARGGSSRAIAYLVDEHKIDVNERTNDGEGASPLWWAEHVLPEGHEAIAVLRRHGAVAIPPNYRLD
jgi:prolyl 4-hydroxylase